MGAAEGQVVEVVARDPCKAAELSAEADTVGGSVVVLGTVPEVGVGQVVGPVDGGPRGQAGVETAGGNGRPGVPA